MNARLHLISTPLTALLVAAAMLASSLAHASAGTDRVCVRGMKSCEMQQVPADHAQADATDSCCRKTAPASAPAPGDAPAQPDSPKTPAPHCPCCVTICSVATWAPLAAGTMLLIDEPATFSSLAAPAPLHGFEWVGDLFRPPCL